MADDERSDETPDGATSPPADATSGGSTPEPPPSAPPPASTPPPQPAPAQWTPAPAKRRRTWLVVLLSILGAMVVVAIAGVALFVTRTLPPYRGAHDFMEALVDGSRSEAVSRLCARDREDPDEAFQSVLRNIAGRGKVEVSVNPFGVSRDGDRATVDYTVSRDDDDFDDDETHELVVVEEDGDWKACPSA